MVVIGCVLVSMIVSKLITKFVGRSNKGRKWIGLVLAIVGLAAGIAAVATGSTSDAGVLSLLAQSLTAGRRVLQLLRSRSVSRATPVGSDAAASKPSGSPE